MSSRRKKNKKRRNQGGDSESSDAFSDGGKTQAGSDRTLDSNNFNMNGLEQDLDGMQEADVIVDARAELDEHLGDLTERKKPTRMAALRSLHKAFSSQNTSEFLMSSRETFTASLSSCLRKGESTEQQLALSTLCTFYLTLASVEIEHSEPKLTEESFAVMAPLLERILAHSSSKTRSMAATAIALGSLVSTTESEETLRLLDYLSSFWLTDSFTKKFQGNVKMKQKVIPPELSVATLDAWALLVSVVPDSTVVERLFPRAISQLLRLLAHDSLEVRISAGRTTALLYASIYRNTADDQGDIPEVTDDVVEVLSALASDASKSQSRDKRREQRTRFRSFLATVESGEEPSETLSLKAGRVAFSGWPQLVQLRAVRDTLKSGFNYHMHNNMFLINLFNLEEAFESGDYYEDKADRRFRERERDDFKKSQRQRKNAFRFHNDE